MRTKSVGQQDGHFRNSVNDGVSPRGAVPIPSDHPVIPMIITQSTHGVVVNLPKNIKNVQNLGDRNTNIFSVRKTKLKNRGLLFK
jgi:hypothetical protein